MRSVLAHVESGVTAFVRRPLTAQNARPAPAKSVNAAGDGVMW